MKLINQKTIDDLISEAGNSPRKRINTNLHPTLDDTIQRFFNVMLPGTYVRPHRHIDDDRWELFVIVRGEAMVVTFNDKGEIAERHCLNPNSANIAIEIPGNTWHTIAATQANTVMFECKTGPYIKLSDKDFASWAPNENNPNKNKFIEWYIQGMVASSPPSF